MRHAHAQARHPQTGSRLERLYGESGRCLHRFKEQSAYVNHRGPHDGHAGGPFHILAIMDATDRFMDWYSHDRAHRP